MSAVTEYLATLEGPNKAELERMCTVVRKMVPGAEEATSYGMPAFRYHQKPLLGFVAAKDHLSLFPFSPGVIEKLKDHLQGFNLSKGTIRFSVEQPLPDETVKLIIQCRLDEIDGR